VDIVCGTITVCSWLHYGLVTHFARSRRNFEGYAQRLEKHLAFVTLKKAVLALSAASTQLQMISWVSDMCHTLGVYRYTRHFKFLRQAGCTSIMTLSFNLDHYNFLVIYGTVHLVMRCHHFTFR